MSDQDRFEHEVQRELYEQEMSAEIGDLVGALAKAQGAMTGAKKDSQNPFFKSNYADLAAVWDACREQLSKNDLAVIQTTEPAEVGVIVVTLLAHKTGQWIRGKLKVNPQKSDPQALGSAITYARRYSLAAVVGLAQVDDDGEAAMNRGGNRKPEPMDTKPIDKSKVYAAVTTAMALVDEEDEGTMAEACRALYEPLTNDERIAFQADMKANKPAGTNKTYWSVFKEWLKISAQAAA